MITVAKTWDESNPPLRLGTTKAFEQIAVAASICIAKEHNARRIIELLTRFAIVKRRPRLRVPYSDCVAWVNAFRAFSPRTTRWYTKCLGPWGQSFPLWAACGWISRKLCLSLTKFEVPCRMIWFERVSYHAFVDIVVEHSPVLLHSDGELWPIGRHDEYQRLREIALAMASRCSPVMWVPRDCGAPMLAFRSCKPFPFAEGRNQLMHRSPKTQTMNTDRDHLLPPTQRNNR